MNDLPAPPPAFGAPVPPENSSGDPQLRRSIKGLGRFLGDALHLAKPYFRSEERWSAWGLLAAIIAMNLFMVAMDLLLNSWNGMFYDALQEKDWNSFIDLLLTWKSTAGGGIMPGFCGIAALYIVVYVYRTYLNQWLQIRWRRWMTSHFLDRWLSDRAYYRIGLAAQGTGADMANGAATGTDNPDQRIAEDLRSYVSDGLSLCLDLLSNVVSLFGFVVILWSLSRGITLFGLTIPGYMVWVAIIYAVVGSVFTHMIGKPLAALNFRRQRVEADFRFSLVRLRENFEGVALYGGETEEKRGLNSRFTDVMANWWAIMQRTKLLNALIAGYGQIAVIFPIVVAAPRYFAGQIALGGLMRTVNAFGQVQGALSWFVNSYSSLASWRATVERLATFDRAIAAARTASARGIAVGTDATDTAELHSLTLTLPNGETLLENASLVIRRGESVVIGGRSGSGKSTLFRALAGIWPFGTGTISRPSGKILFLPQRPYIPLGTLRHAVAYPSEAGAFDDAHIGAALADVGLAPLFARLDDDENWSQRLSGGEQQRLAMARALLNRPDWLFLDEATASLDPEAEREIYTALRTQLPDTTMVSISHRPAVDAMHDRHIRIERHDGRGQLLEVEPVRG